MDTIVPGALAAFVVDCSIFPLDTIKSRIQAADYNVRYPGGKGLYKGLWQGFGPVVVATLPSAALFFTTYEHAKITFTSPATPLIGKYVENDSRAKAIGHAAASAVAEMAACLILTPAETIKQQRQVSASDALKESSSVFKDLKLKALRQGYWALVSRNLPFTAMQFPLYEYFRQHLIDAFGIAPRKPARRAAHQQEPKDNADIDASSSARKRAYFIQQKAIRNDESQSSSTPSIGTPNYIKAGLVSGVSAASAGAISALITTPLDLVKTRIMLGPTKGELQKASSQSIVNVGKDIWQKEGLRGLMKGGTLRSAWTALGAGIYLGSYESGREWWGNSGKEQARQTIEEIKEKAEEVQTNS